MQLFKHQQEALNRATQGNHAIFHDCGAGKTCTAINIIKHWRDLGQGPALVICPLSIIESAWIADTITFAPELSITSLWHKPGAKKKAYQRQQLAKDYDIYVANFETFKALFSELQQKRFSVLIVDESSKMKSHSAQITKALLSMAGITYRTKTGATFKTDHIVPHRYVLSGTPAPNNEIEYWPQIKFITGAGNDVFNDNFYAFRGMYFFDKFKNAKGTLAQDWLIRKELKQDFMEAMQSVAHVVKKEDAADLPDKLHETRGIELSKEEQKAYDTMKNDLVLEFGSDEVLAANAMTEVMKLRQLTSGFIYSDTGVHTTGKSKLKELKDLLEEIGNKQVIIWANFKHEIKQILELLPNSAALWSGTHDREQVINDFKSGKIQYLIANPASAAHGLTFVNCNYAVYYSMNYSYELQKQSEDRIHRIGQNNKCTYFYLIANDTIDGLIYQAVKDKAALSNVVLDFLRESRTRTVKNGHGRQETKGFASISA